jgi:hypothetical protein
VREAAGAAQGGSLSRARSSLEARADLAARLRERQGELGQAAMVRIYGIAEPSEVDPEYLHGLREAVSAALGYALASIELGEHRAPPVPAILLTQARLAARNGIGLDTVLRRYFAGYSLLHELLVAEAEQSGFGVASLREVLRGQAALFDRLLAAVSDEHQRESASRIHTVQQRRREHVERMLAGDPIDATALEYELDLFHLGVIGHGDAAAAAVRELAQCFERRLLLVHSDADRFWAWLGSRRPIAPEAMVSLVDVASGLLSQGEILAFGEPSEGFRGWRLTHQQAKAALPVARATGEPVVRYSEVTLLASVLQDEVVAASLRELYLDPLQRGSDGGTVLRETLKAYFAAGSQSSSAAAALGVTRRTVRNRLRDVEERLGLSVDARAAELWTALLLAELDDAADENVAIKSPQLNLRPSGPPRRRAQSG